MSLLFGVVGEDDLVGGGGAFFVCQTHQQFLPLDARSAVVVADEFGEVEGVVGLFPVLSSMVRSPVCTVTPSLPYT